jgi:hypothetical protein
MVARVDEFPMGSSLLRGEPMGRGRWRLNAGSVIVDLPMLEANMAGLAF